MSKLRDMLYQSTLAEKSKALLTLDLLENHPAGIGDHSTDDFYKNADDKLEAIEKYLVKKQVI